MRFIQWFMGLFQWPDVEEITPTSGVPANDGPTPTTDIRLSPHFLQSEFTHSFTAKRLGIDNTPSLKHAQNLTRLAETLERVRAILGHPISISSGYRSPALNKAVGGSATSDHANGLAADFTCSGYGSAQQVCEAILAAGIPFDQLIFEQNKAHWVHLGIGVRMRRQALSWSPSSGYVRGIQRLE